MLAAFFGLLRSGEYTTSSQNTASPLTRLDLSLLSNHASIRLKSSKTDQFHLGCNIYLPRNDGNPLCPYSALVNMLRSSPSAQYLFEIKGLPTLSL